MADTSRRVAVRNLTRGTVLAANMRLARAPIERMVGLMRTPLGELGDGLMLEGAPSIHMFFMSYPIDAVFVDREARVRRIAAGLRPWQVVWWARGAQDCLELPAGRVTETGTQVGDRLEVSPVSVE